MVCLDFCGVHSFRIQRGEMNARWCEPDRRPVFDGAMAEAGSEGDSGATVNVTREGLANHHSTARSLHVSRAEILRHVAGEGIQKGEQVRLLRIGEMKFEEQV